MGCLPPINWCRISQPSAVVWFMGFTTVLLMNNIKWTGLRHFAGQARLKPMALWILLVHTTFADETIIQLILVKSTYFSWRNLNVKSQWLSCGYLACHVWHVWWWNRISSWPKSLVKFARSTKSVSKRRDLLVKSHLFVVKSTMFAGETHIRSLIVDGDPCKITVFDGYIMLYKSPIIYNNLQADHFVTIWWLSPLYGWNHHQNTFFLLQSHLVGMSSFPLTWTPSFFRGVSSNHQPDYYH